MAKRQRGGSHAVHRRPSARQQRPAERPAGPVTPRPATSLTPEEEARAAEIEARILAEERAAEDATRRTRERARIESAGRTRDATPLTVRRAQEYAYVRRDVVRIAQLSAFLLAILLVLHVLINVTGTITI